MKKFYLTCFLSFLISVSFAQFSITSADIYLGLKKLNVLGTVLYIAAHPDDENTRLLSYFSKDRLYRTGYLSITRGDGGQNLIGDEQGIALGLIRTQELLSARKVDGAEQFFTRAYDFGFSKNPEETFTKWDKEKILADVVWIVRKFQPDVIITRFPTTGEGGHGHHTASAILAIEAFNAAADPSRFPEQLKYVTPWKAKRVLWNVFGGQSATGSDIVRFDVGGFNPVLGKSYGEIAAESRSQHKSQGFGVPRSRGEAIETFKLLGGSSATSDLFEDVDISWNKIKGGKEVEDLIQKIVSSFDFLQPQNSVPQLSQLYKAIAQLQDGYWKTQKLREVQQLIEQASSVWLDATTTVQNAVQGDSLQINFSLNNRSGSNILLKNVSVETIDTSFNLSLPKNKNVNFSRSIFISYEKPISQPYWLKEQKSEGMFTVADQQMIGQADITPSFIAKFDVEINGEKFRFTKPVQYKFTDPVRGELYQPIFVMPPMTLIASPDLILFRKDEKQEKELTVQLNANKKILPTRTDIELRSPNYYFTKSDASFTLDKGKSRFYNFNISNEKLKNKEEDNVLSFAHFKNGNTDHDAYLALTGIHYDHVPTIRYFYPDAVKVLNIDLKTIHKKIGYIVGAGDKVPEALEDMGYEVVLLTDKELTRNNLQQFDAIISGVRAYNTNEWLNNHYDKLMKYVEAGGNLIVQYNTSNQLGPVRAKIGPYEFNISRNRITDEKAAVSFLKPDHPVLNYPNKITSKDFEGWVQERSIYHATDADKNFEQILSMNDPNENPDNGSLIVAKYGKGFFTYTGLVFFRELPAGVPGAYRLFANLIALNRKKEF